MTLDQSSIYIGTSGIVLLGNKTTFPEEFRSSTRLQYYSSIFNSLEINSSFYKLPQAKTFAKWSHEVTENFTFSVKLSQSITHADKLNFEVEDIEKFTSATKELEKHKGAVLIQFPANITVDYSEKVLNILHHLTSLHTCSSWKLAVEVRHKIGIQMISMRRSNDIMHHSYFMICPDRELRWIKLQLNLSTCGSMAHQGNIQAPTM